MINSFGHFSYLPRVPCSAFYSSVIACVQYDLMFVWLPTRFTFCSFNKLVY